MGSTCCIKVCPKANQVQEGKLFRIPKKTASRRTKFIQAIGHNDFHENSRVCGLHFCPEDIKPNGRLKNDVIPTLYLTEPAKPRNVKSTFIICDKASRQPEEKGLPNPIPLLVVEEKFFTATFDSYLSQAPTNKQQNLISGFAPCEEIGHMADPIRKSSLEDKKYFLELLQNEPENDPLFIPSYEDDISIKEEMKLEETC